eukprot:g4346.t1
MLLIATLYRRLRASFSQRPTAANLRNGVICFSIHAIVSLVFALLTRFATRESPPSLRNSVQILVVAFFIPSLAEEVLFRGLLLPNRQVDGPDVFEPLPMLLYGAFSVGLFVVYHLSPYHKPKKVMSDPRFLTLAGVLGVSCTVVYLDSGSIWLPTMIHYLTVVAWALFFGGFKALKSE